jgi:hypothetical protein
MACNNGKCQSAAKASSELKAQIEKELNTAKADCKDNERVFAELLEEAKEKEEDN